VGKNGTCNDLRINGIEIFSLKMQKLEKQQKQKKDNKPNYMPPKF